MLISLEMASSYLDTTKDDLYANSKYRKFIIKQSKNSKFDIDAYYKSIENKQKELDFRIDMVNFAEFVLKKIGENKFLTAIPTLKRQGIKKGFENSKFSLNEALLINQTFKNYLKAYELDNEENNKAFIPLEKRKPLTTDFIINRYWTNKRTTLEIAQELNVPESWVQKEIKRLKLGKKENGIMHKGRKGFVMSKEQREKRQNQPHAKPIVQICPKTFQIVREYSSKGAVERYGFSRENVRRAINNGGLHKNFLWALKGFEQPTIKVVLKRGNLETKLRASKYKRPSKEELNKFYIVKNLTLDECANIFKCHRTTIAHLAIKYQLKKRTEKIDIKELERLYVDEKLKAKEIALKYGYTTKSIATYLSRNGIKKRSNKEGKLCLN
ncbi:hypothetical protein RJ999_06160 [Aliarcobacter butzleri]|uniref:hypothetical protein n=1 Tax=Aliarcobacter butzleri TaxID=28197 RepID=UPI00287517F3|nr:hypothetical protein [Aliarcobacter butzleri]MDS1370682.1 hypothetical protein [Aliarcobacter butzleri]